MIRRRVLQVQGTPQLFVPRTTNRFRSSWCAITATKIVRLWQLHLQGERLEQPEDFEDDHDNDNHSNYIKDISVHKGHSYQIACAMVKIYPKLISHSSKIA
jgi:hypothetical protein